MANFPENEMEILDDYVSDDFIAGMTEGFSRDSLGNWLALIETDRFDITSTVQLDQLKRIFRARKSLLGFFNHPVFTNSRDDLRAVMDKMVKGKFQDAQTLLNDPANFASVTIAFDLVNAFNSSPVKFTWVEIQEFETLSLAGRRLKSRRRARARYPPMSAQLQVTHRADASPLGATSCPRGPSIAFGKTCCRRRLTSSYASSKIP